MDIKINLENSDDSKIITNRNNAYNKKGKCDIVIDNEKFQKMLFFYNTINDGWTVKKKKEKYLFTKKHEGKKQIFDETYLLSFIKDNLDINK